MSSALAMVLTAAMAVPGSGPEQVSAEMEQGLDLRGKWEGYLFQSARKPCRVWLQGTELRELLKDGEYVTHKIEFTDAGQGAVNITLAVRGIETISYRGVYKHEDARLLIRFSQSGVPGRTSFQAGTRQCLLFLCRVKPRK
jgi:hypothetical protein